MTLSTDSPNQGAILRLNADGGGDGDGDGDGDGTSVEQLIFGARVNGVGDYLRVHGTGSDGAIAGVTGNLTDKVVRNTGMLTGITWETFAGDATTEFGISVNGGPPFLFVLPTPSGQADLPQGPAPGIPVTAGDTVAVVYLSGTLPQFSTVEVLLEFASGGDGDGDGDCVPVARTLITSFAFDSTAEMETDPGEPPQEWPIVADGWVSFDFAIDVREKGDFQNANEFEINLKPLGPGSVGLDIESRATLSFCSHKPSGQACEVEVRCRANYPGAGFILLGPPNASGSPHWCFAFGGQVPDEYTSPTISVIVPRWSDVDGATGAPWVSWEMQRAAGNDGLIEIEGATFSATQLLPVYTQEAIENCESGDGDGDGDCPVPIEAFVTDNFGNVTPVVLGDGPGSFALAPVPPSGGPWTLDIVMDQAFDSSEYTTELALDGVPIPPGVPPGFWSVVSLPPGPPGTQTIWRFTMGVTAPSTGPTDVFIVRVFKTLDFSCVFTQGFVLTSAA